MTSLSSFSTPTDAPDGADRSRVLAVSALLLALGLTGAACTGSGDSSDATTDFETSEPAATDETVAETPDDVVEAPAEDPVAELPAPEWGDLALELQEIAEFTVPISVVARSGSIDLYVVERGGMVKRVVRQFTQNGTEQIQMSNRLMLDLTGQVSLDGEQGLLDIAFSTDGRYLYVSYTDLAGDSVIDEYDVSRSEIADVDSRRELLRVDQPYANHNGGDIDLGPDGYLYIGFGDGGSSNDPDGNAQNPDTLLGSILRIDPYPDGDNPYTIPPGNPYGPGGDLEGEGAPETWLIGVRNPWRFSFDSTTGDLWIADVGQDASEEIDVLRDGADDLGRGANLGWPALEGFTETGNGSVPDGAVAPIAVYPHGDGNCSITGGVVYRGLLNPLLDGVYIFGDYCSGKLWGLQELEGQIQVWPLTIQAAPGELVSIDEGPDNEIYITEAGGRVSRLEPREATEENG